MTAFTLTEDVVALPTGAWAGAHRRTLRRDGKPVLALSQGKHNESPYGCEPPPWDVPPVFPREKPAQGNEQRKGQQKMNRDFSVEGLAGEQWFQLKNTFADIMQTCVVCNKPVDHPAIGSDECRRQAKKER